MPSRKPIPEWLVIVGVYMTLTVLVWGLFALDRGTWQDEVIILNPIQSQSGNPLAQMLTPIVTPTRILLGTAFAFAQWSGSLILFVLQFLYGLTWFGTGVLAYLLARRLFPQHAWLAYIAGALTLSATGDFTVNYLCTLGIALSVALYFASVVCLLQWWQDGGRKWFGATGVCLSISVWMYDAVLAAILLTPGLLWALDNFRLTRRLTKAMLFWYGLMVPYLIVFTAFLLNPASYAADVLVPMTLGERFERTMLLFGNNFTPWKWALGRRQWFPALPPVLPRDLRLALTLVGTLVFLGAAVWLWRRQPEARDQPRKGGLRFALVGAICLLMALASNAIYASVQYSQFFFRTQWVSRIWASLALSLLAYGLGVFALRRPYLALILPTVFVGFGIYSGLERQDYYLGYWRKHQAELRSIVEQVPGLQPDARLILYVPPGSPYLATEATYLARSWLSYLYGDPSLATRVFLWSSDRNTSCAAGADAFVCRGEVSQACYDSGECAPETLPYDRSVLLIYSPAQNRYVLQGCIPPGLLGNTPLLPDGYNPRVHIVHRPLPAYAQALLYSPQYLGTLFPGECPLENLVTNERLAAIAGIENLNGIEQTENGEQFLWIGQGDTVINVVSYKAGTVALEGYFLPGPSLPETAVRRLLVRTDQDYEKEETLTDEGDRVISVPVVEGITRIVLHPLDKPTAQLPNDPRPLLLGVQGLRVGGFFESQ
jgi:hypothetical protein